MQRPLPPAGVMRSDCRSAVPSPSSACLSAEAVFFSPCELGLLGHVSLRVSEQRAGGSGDPGCAPLLQAPPTLRQGEQWLLKPLCRGLLKAEPSCHRAWLSLSRAGTAGRVSGVTREVAVGPGPVAHPGPRGLAPHPPQASLGSVFFSEPCWQGYPLFLQPQPQALGGVDWVIRSLLQPGHSPGSGGDPSQLWS